MRILLSTTALATMLVLGGAAWAQAPGGAQGGQSQSEQTQDGADGIVDRGVLPNATAALPVNVPGVIEPSAIVEVGGPWPPYSFAGLE